MERTYLMVKPDGVQRGLVGKIIARFERKGLKIVGLKMIRLDRALADKHYAEHVGKPFFAGLVNFITSGPVVCMVVAGKDAVAISREMMGVTNPAKANPGSIRGAFGIDIGRNIIHGSDSPASAEREIALYFTPQELVEYDRAIDTWIYE